MQKLLMTACLVLVALTAGRTTLQAASSDWNDLSILKPGQQIRVELHDAKSCDGVFQAVNAEGITLRQAAGERTLVRNDVLRVYFKSKNHRARNFAIGAGIGLGLAAIGYAANKTSGIGLGVIAVLPPPISRKRLTPNDKFKIYIHQNYGPQNIILPAIAAGFIMADPPSDYPHDWKDGGGAFGRWYGNQIVASTSRRTGQFLTTIALHEDPRYVPSGSKNVAIRTFHALAFTFVDKTDSGRNAFAFSNFAGAEAGGLVGMAYLPDGYGDIRHAERRALRGLESVAIRNIVTEFQPEWSPVLKKIHVPSILPEWWPARKSPQP